MYRPRDSLGARPERLGAMLERLGDVEICVVRVEAARVRGRHARRAALAINWLATGWLYGGVAIALVLLQGVRARSTLTAMALSLIGSHVVYPFIKAYVARPRPFECDPALSCLTHPLDRFSFPSGHCMTAAAALFPIMFVYPGTLAPVIVYSTSVAWARLALAHHYPSDVMAGVMLGLAVAIPVTYVVCR
jgi:undecaprenyl-diphosphatase